MATRTFKPVLGKRIRATALTEGGAVLPGPEGTSLTTDGFITVTLSSEVEEGVEIIQKLANGSLCINEKFSDSFKYLTVEITFCGVNPSLLAITTNAEEYLDGEDVIGFTVGEGAIEKWFALELWTGLSGQIGTSSGNAASGYLLLPFITAGVVGEIAVDGENAVTFSMTGARTKGGNGWGVGPYDVMSDEGGLPAALPTALDPMDHLLMVLSELAVPAANDQPEPNPTV